MRDEDALLLLRDDGTIAWANDAASRLLGFSPGELKQMALPLVGSPGSPSDRPPGPVANAFHAIVSGQTQMVEGNARFPDKENKRVAVHWKLWALPTTSEDGNVLLSLSETAQGSADGPITAGYRDVFEYAVEGFFRSTVEGQLIEVNPAFARIFGFRTPAELVTSISDLAVQLYRDPRQREEFARIMLERDVVNGFEAEVFRADGSLIWVAVFARTVRDSTGVPLYFEGSIIDITEKKRAEDAIKRSEERFRRLVESANVVPFEFDPRTATFTYFGPQAEVLLGRRFRAGLPLEDWAAVAHRHDVPESLRFVNESGPTSSRDFQTEFRFVAPDGRIIWVKQLVHRGEDDAGRNRLRGFLLDITEAKTSEAERERSRLQLREFAERCQQVREEERLNVAREIHDELGQALTLFKIDLAWLMGRIAKVEAEEIRKPIEEKIASSEQLVDATLKTMRRILAALRPPLLTECGLRDAIEFHVLEFSKRLGIRCELDLSPVVKLPDNVTIAVFRVFQEILTNVARHAKASRIKVTLRADDAQLTMSIEDNGCGITKDKFAQNKCFGLMGIQERAIFMGGEVEIRGSPRSGTMVTLRVPIASTADGAASASAA